MITSSLTHARVTRPYLVLNFNWKADQTVGFRELQLRPPWVQGAGVHHRGEFHLCSTIFWHHVAVEVPHALAGMPPSEARGGGTGAAHGRQRR